jgi:hypothetical protein
MSRYGWEAGSARRRAHGRAALKLLFRALDSDGVRTLRGLRYALTMERNLPKKCSPI